jgi:UDP-hydrolysing UDP-N-acetyl-D-glucosamine 2-epimerase
MVDALDRLEPDVMLVLGDRYEIFAAVQAAMLTRTPVAHIAGGDVTEGAIDDAMRHAITKVAHLHFATNAESAARIRQMGEADDRIFVTGNPALDQLRRVPLMDRAALEVALGQVLGHHNILMTFHPVTLAADLGLSELDALLSVLSEQPDDTTIWITRSNADSGGAQVNAKIDAWAAGRSNVHVYTSLGLPRYMALLAQCDLVIGNSSSGLYEAPSFGTPTVNIGARQGGRLAANSIFTCLGEADAIRAAMAAAFVFDRASAVNPYGDGQSAARIIAALKSVPDSATLLHKRFAAMEG